jgi:hypothetical protein
MKWILYWCGLIAALFSVLWFKNKKSYTDKTKQWQFGKSIIECILLVLAAAFMPAILVVYASMYFTQWIRRPAFRIGAGFIIGTILMMTLGWALELLVLAGCFAINLISDDFLSFMEERRIKRGIATVMDGQAS